MTNQPVRKHAPLMMMRHTLSRLEQPARPLELGETGGGLVHVMLCELAPAHPIRIATEKVKDDESGRLQRSGTGRDHLASFQLRAGAVYQFTKFRSPKMMRW